MIIHKKKNFTNPLFFHYRVFSLSKSGASVRKQDKRSSIKLKTNKTNKKNHNNKSRPSSLQILQLRISKILFNFCFSRLNANDNQNGFSLFPFDFFPKNFRFSPPSSFSNLYPIVLCRGSQVGRKVFEGGRHALQ